ncbi:sporulation protein YqfC [Clostridium sp. P21]|uniref:Sporulation protein YqfC n=1 Tax=Clostridium muellerianum TaxID=2716538 RepID=A0A7Y0EGC8_9CLOT|nr:sporulation protein YqfC [Clostridium muellerianum]
MKLNRTKQNIANKLDLPRDVILNVPKITVTGHSEIIIENHRGVAVFNENEVKVNSGIGSICIHGSQFEILFMGGTTLTVGGKFKSIVYEANE